jgi:hypothetical protein
MSDEHLPTETFLRTSDAGRFLGLSGRTLEKHRTYGAGPIYRKLGGRVVYALSDLRLWADRGAKASTSEGCEDPVRPAHARWARRSPMTRRGRPAS